jgi:Flp pilus assembly CpaF family ATPase
MVNCIPPQERIITVERALELGLRHNPDLHWDVVEMEEVLPDVEGRGGISIDQLVRRTRRHNPDRVIVGEVLGPEVVQMLSAMSQGNDGSLSTIHARDADDVFHKLATYAAQFERLDFPVTHSLMAGSIDFVVFIRKNPLMNNLRTVTEVIEVTGINEGRVTRSKIFAESDVDGRAERMSEVAIMRADRLASAGYNDLIPIQPQWYAQGV